MRWQLCRAVLFLLVKKGALMNFAKRAEETESAIIKDRHFLHEHAELSFEEKETTAYLVSELEKMGIPVQTFPDYTGCIATIKGEKGDGPTILAPRGHRCTPDHGGERSRFREQDSGRDACLWP